MKKQITPTEITYTSLDQAYAFFNLELFGSKLPPCLITLVSKRTAKGYFSWKKFEHKETKKKTDEIALNPDLLKERSLAETLSTLVHEMCHLKQYHFGKPSRGGYHNREWANYMLEVGLIPSNTGEIGEKETGPKMTHYIDKDGKFLKSFKKLEKNGFKLPWQNSNTPLLVAVARKKAESKTKFTCGSCQQNAWAKPSANLVCGDCQETMI